MIDTPWERMELTLERLLRDTGAREAFVIDRKGRLLASGNGLYEAPDLGRPSRRSSLAEQLKHLGAATELRNEGRLRLFVHRAGPRMLLLAIGPAGMVVQQPGAYLLRAANHLRTLLDRQLRSTNEFGPHSDLLPPVTAHDIDALFSPKRAAASE